MIVEDALPPFTTVNLILLAVLDIHPVTAPVESVAPAEGIATLVTPPTAAVEPTAKVIEVGFVA